MFCANEAKMVHMKYIGERDLYINPIKHIFSLCYFLKKLLEQLIK